MLSASSTHLISRLAECRVEPGSPADGSVEGGIYPRDDIEQEGNDGGGQLCEFRLLRVWVERPKNGGVFCIFGHLLCIEPIVILGR